MKKVGFTIGKFAPLHKGHQYLIEKALKEMDVLYIIVYETDVIEIPIERRAAWIKNIYPTVNILYAYNPPSRYGLDETSVNIQLEYLCNILETIKVTHFYSSEPYGKYVAKYLNIKEVLVDKERIKLPIHASNIRDNPDKYIEFLDKRVYQDLKMILK